MSKYSLIKLGFRPRPKKDLRSLFAAKPEPPLQHHSTKLETDLADRDQYKPLPRFAHEFFEKLRNFGNTNELNEVAGNMPFMP